MIPIDQISFDNTDSQEEVYFTWWLLELIKEGYISSAVYKPQTFTFTSPVVASWMLEKKTKCIIQTAEILKGHSYTPDFLIEWTDKAEGLFFIPVALGYTNPLIIGQYRKRPFGKIPFIAEYYEGNSLINSYSYIDVKGDFAKAYIKSTIIFPINQKLVFDKYNKIVNKAKIPDLFKKTFTPEKYRYCNKKVDQPRTIHFSIRSIQQYVEGIKSEVSASEITQPNLKI